MTITSVAGTWARLEPQGLRADLVEDVVLPVPLSEDDLELLGREDRLLVLEDVLDRDPRARRVHPCIDAIAHQELGRHEVHQEDRRAAAVLLRERLQVPREAASGLADLLRDEDPEALRVAGPGDRGVPLPQDAVPHF